MSDAYFLAASLDDKHDANRCKPDQPVSAAFLAACGLTIFSVDFKNADPTLSSVIAGCGYTYHDRVSFSSRDPDIERTCAKYWVEHLHADPEVRLITAGSGYFDIKHEGRWIRIAVKACDFISVPAGMYHRFTLDKSMFIEALRFFQRSPEWVGYPRCPATDAMPAHVAYEARFGPSDAPIAQGTEVVASFGSPVSRQSTIRLPLLESAAVAPCGNDSLT